MVEVLKLLTDLNMGGHIVEIVLLFVIYGKLAKQSWHIDLMWIDYCQRKKISHVSGEKERDI